jgi:acetoacetyl-CoA reductase
MTSRVALVTGGTGGIGTAICQRLADQGHRVATNYRDEAKARAWQQSMTERGYQVSIFPGDVSDSASAEALIRAVEAELGPVEILVNNAGITRDTTFHRMRAEQWHDVINTNLNSGRVIQISSINGLKGQYGQANYAAAKAGMHGFTISLARENAGFGITVNTISPGYVATDMVMAVPEEVRAKIIADIPTGRLGKPEEIAYGVSFLVAEEASWITGSNLDINGGHHMGW